MLRRRLTGFESDFLRAPETVQLAVRMRNSADAQIAMDILQRGVIGLRLKISDDEMVMTNDTGIVGEIRKGIETPREACQFVAQQNLNGRFARVFRSGNLIAMSAIHSIADGGFVKNLLSRIDSGLIEKCDELPATLDTIFQDKIESVTSNDVGFPDGHRLSFMPLNRRPISLATAARYVTSEDPATSFLCYDHRKGAPKGLTDAYWTAMVLAAASMRNDSSFFKNVGVNNCVDLRKFMGSSGQRLNVCNNFTIVNSVASIEDETVPVKEIGRRMRQDFTTKIQGESLWKSVKACYRGFPREPILHSILQLSNVGPIRCDRAEDFWAQQFVKSIYCEFGLSVLSFSKVTNSRNTIVTRLRYAPTVCTDEDAMTYTTRVLTAMMKIPEDTPIKDAVKFLSSTRSYE